VQRRFLSH